MTENMRNKLIQARHADGSVESESGESRVQAARRQRQPLDQRHDSSHKKVIKKPLKPVTYKSPLFRRARLRQLLQDPSYNEEQ